MINVMTARVLHLVGEMSAELSRAYEGAKVSKEETAPHSPVKVGGSDCCKSV